MYYNTASNQAKICINGAWVALGVPEVSVLPASPADGDEVYFVADATNNIKWHLKYKSSILKWEFLGGASLMARVETEEAQLNDNIYTDLATVGPTVTVPLTGTYRIRVGTQARWNNYQGTSNMSFAVGATAATDADAAASSFPAAQYGSVASGWVTKTGVPAATAITSKYKFPTSGGQYPGYFKSRWIEILPISF